MIQIILPSLVLIAVYIGGLILKSYWPKYFEAKATNQATKEDIGKITSIVESIKTDLQQKTEQLKAQISFINQHRLSVKAAEREAILDYSKRLSAYLYYLVGLSFSGYDIVTYKNLLNERAEINKKKYDYDVSQAYLGLFLNDNEFIMLQMHLNMGMIDYEALKVSALLNIYNLYKMADIQLSANRTDELQIMARLYKDIQGLSAQHQNEALEKYKGIVIQNALLMNFLRERNRVQDL
jgi:hypothetical protein